MNEAEAKRILGARLVFGNEDQIRAIKFLEKLSDAREVIESCKGRRLHKRDMALPDDRLEVCNCVEKVFDSFDEDVIDQIKRDVRFGRFER